MGTGKAGHITPYARETDGKDEPLRQEVFTVERLDHLVLSVASLDASARFYETICGMRRVTFDGDRVAMVFGAHKLNLNERAPELPASPPLDFCLTTNRTAGEVLIHVRSHGITEMLGPVPRSGALGRMLSVYILDPDRNIVELASYVRARPDRGSRALKPFRRRTQTGDGRFAQGSSGAYSDI